MGKYLLSIFVVLASLSLPSNIKAFSDQIHVTATVLPSPAWIKLIQANSQTTLFGTHLRVKLSDGSILLKNQQVSLVTTSSRQNAKTDSTGIVWFELPTSSYELFYSIMDQNILIPPPINTYQYLSYRFNNIADFSSIPSLIFAAAREPVVF